MKNFTEKVKKSEYFGALLFILTCLLLLCTSQYTRHFLSLCGLYGFFCFYYLTLYSFYVNIRVAFDERCAISGFAFHGMERLDKYFVLSICTLIYWVEWFFFQGSNNGGGGGGGLIHPLCGTTFIPLIVFGISLISIKNSLEHKIKI